MAQHIKSYFEESLELGPMELNIGKTKDLSNCDKTLNLKLSDKDWDKTFQEELHLLDQKNACEVFASGQPKQISLGSGPLDFCEKC